MACRGECGRLGALGGGLELGTAAGRQRAAKEPLVSCSCRCERLRLQGVRGRQPVRRLTLHAFAFCNMLGLETDALGRPQCTHFACGLHLASRATGPVPWQPPSTVKALTLAAAMRTCCEGVHALG
jgi:hypothetical protein